jgi:hypothetical protein
MPYVVRAIIDDKGGTFTVEATTEDEAVAKANTLRNYCRSVTVTDSDGKVVFETKD